MTTATLSIENSTIVRPRPIPVPRPIRVAFRWGGAVAPKLAASAARRLFFTPPPTSLRPEQAAILGRGRRLDLETRAGRIAAWTWGIGEPVLLLHGWGGHAGQMTPFVAPLVERRFRVVALDLPAHGASPGRLASARHFAEAILDATPSFGTLAGVVAHSLGGAAATLAFDGGLYARAAVFLAPPSRFGTFFDRFSAALGLSGRVRSGLERGAEDWVGRRFDEIEPRGLASHQDAPLLVVHDRGDDEVPYEEGDELAGRWPGAELRATTGLGHNRLLRDPETIRASVDFLLAHDGRRIHWSGRRPASLSVAATAARPSPTPVPTYSF
jgi:pimeloyl-ACP methyl ester carboxylesterase